MRCADSEISMRRSLNGPVLIELSSSWWGRAMLPQPKNVCFASDQMVEIATLSQTIRMCSSDSGEVLQLAQRALSAC